VKISSSSSSFLSQMTAGVKEKKIKVGRRKVKKAKN
jgi:hypothetical protein